MSHQPLKKPYRSTTTNASEPVIRTHTHTNTLFTPRYTHHCAPVLATVDVFSVNDQEPPPPPLLRRLPKKWAAGLGGPGNWLSPPAAAPSRSPSGRPRAPLARAKPPISRALTGNQSLDLAGNMRWWGGGRWGLRRSMRSSRPVGALMHGQAIHTHL